MLTVMFHRLAILYPALLPCDHQLISQLYLTLKQAKTDLHSRNYY